MKSRIFTERGNEGEKSFCLSQADQGFSLRKKENGCSFVQDTLCKASWALSYYKSPQTSLNFLAHCRVMQPLVHDMDNWIRIWISCGIQNFTMSLFPLLFWNILICQCQEDEYVYFIVF